MPVHSDYRFWSGHQVVDRAAGELGGKFGRPHRPHTFVFESGPHDSTSGPRQLLVPTCAVHQLFVAAQLQLAGAPQGV